MGINSKKTGRARFREVHGDWKFEDAELVMQSQGVYFFAANKFNVGEGYGGAFFSEAHGPFRNELTSHALEHHVFTQRRDSPFAHHGCHNRPTGRRHTEERIAHGNRQKEDFDLGPWFATHAARHGHGHDRRCAGD